MVLSRASTGLYTDYAIVGGLAKRGCVAETLVVFTGANTHWTDACRSFRPIQFLRLFRSTLKRIVFHMRRRCIQSVDKADRPLGYV